MRWYYVQFDPNWVVCKNHACKAMFLRSAMARRRKCPKCQRTSAGCVPNKKVT
jgi:hypothetical protein